VLRDHFTALRAQAAAAKTSVVRVAKKSKRTPKKIKRGRSR
jgi:hypothetical protein